MTSYVADFFLFFANLYTTISILCLGCIFFGWRFLFHGIVILSIDIILNVALKGTFKIPLSPSLGVEGYAFPSGHMQMATVFYLWMARFIPFWLWEWVSVLIFPGVGFGLIHYGFHNLVDVIGGFVVGAALVTVYCIALDRQYKSLSVILLAIASGLMVYNAVMYSMIPRHAWLFFYALCVVFILEFVWRNFHGQGRDKITKAC